LESAGKSSLGYLHALLTAATAAEEVIAGAEDTPAATGALLVFGWDEDLVEE
jgi:hypothetical protein